MFYFDIASIAIGSVQKTNVSAKEKPKPTIIIFNHTLNLKLGC
jgi:hypothetical protein